MIESGLTLAKAAGADYAEVLAVNAEDKQLRVENGEVARLERSENAGLAVRVLIGGRWGFASGPAEGSSVIKRLTGAALAAAQHEPKPLHPVRLSACFPVQGQWEGPCQINPFAKSDRELMEVLMAADEAMNIPGIGHRLSAMHFRREDQLFINSEGTKINQAFFLSGGGLRVWAPGQGEVQQRSWPCPGGSCSGRGYEYLEELDLPGHAGRIAREAVDLTAAPLCPDGITDLLLTGSQLAAQIHYTCGYRAQLGMPNAFPPEQAGTYRFGSPHITITADSAWPGGPGSFGWDREGVRAQSFALVKEGKLINYLSGREQAASIGRFSSGTMRSPSWLEPPLPKMTNLLLQPGSGSLQDLVKGIERGIILDTSRSFSFGPNLLGFIAQAEMGWMIEQGEITHMVRNPVYKGYSTAFWSGCDAVAGPEQQEVIGVMDNGIAIGHIVVPVRIRGVKVGAWL